MIKSEKEEILAVLNKINRVIISDFNTVDLLDKFKITTVKCTDVAL